MTLIRGLTHRGTAWAQIVLSILYNVGYFYILYMFVAGKVHLQPEYKDTFGPVLGVLTTGEILILNFWFTRQRESHPVPSVQG